MLLTDASILLNWWRSGDVIWERIFFLTEDDTVSRTVVMDDHFIPDMNDMNGEVEAFVDDLNND